MKKSVKAIHYKMEVIYNDGRSEIWGNFTKTQLAERKKQYQSLPSVSTINVWREW